MLYETDLQSISTTPAPVLIHDISFPANTPIKWGSVAQMFPRQYRTWGELRPHLLPMTNDPRAHDVFIAQVQLLGRHEGIEHSNGRLASFLEGDILVGAFGYRYATRQFEGDIPPLSDTYDMLSQGGVCGRVCSAPLEFDEPTILKPLGYLTSEHGGCANLRDYGLKKSPVQNESPIILVVGSSMDAGKTTTAAGIIRGLTRSGLHVNAGKLTGTACVKDLNKYRDAGAVTALDFNHVGFASTAMATEQELQDIADVLISQLSTDSPAYVVLEIADGIIQRETQMLLYLLSQQQRIGHLALAVHDVMAAPSCVELLKKEWGIVPRLVSGSATFSPLSTIELNRVVNVSCFTKEQLGEPSIHSIFDSTATG